jgi:SprT-like protein
MSAPVNARLGPDETAGNLLHELVHWRLYTVGSPFKDVDAEFVAECLRVGAPFSRTQAAMRAYETYMQTQKEEAA